MMNPEEQRKGATGERMSENRSPDAFFDRLVLALGAIERDAKAFAFKLAPHVRPGSGRRGWVQRDQHLALLLGELSSRATKTVEALRAVEGQLRLYPWE